MSKKLRDVLRKTFKRWIPLSVLAGLIIFVVYGEVQQMLRQTANDPQIQIAQDLAYQLTLNTDNLSQIQPVLMVDLSRSEATFNIIYDANFKVVYSEAKLNGVTPTLPEGVLQFAKDNGENKVTWQPANNVRIAAVVEYYTSQNGDGYILVGRSLKETELRADNALLIASVGFGGTIVVLFGVLAVVNFLYYDKKTNKPR